MKSDKYNVIAVHFSTDCNLACPICYRKKNVADAKPFTFFYNLVPYLSKLTDQIALGGGEPFLYPEFIKKFSALCKKHGMICNITTNGTIFIDRDTLKDVEMVSVSFDRYKIRENKDIERYKRMVEYLSKVTRVGANLLVDKSFVDKPSSFYRAVEWLFKIGVERVYALYPKLTDKVDILKIRHLYYLLTLKHKHFYVDDLTSMILSEKSYSNWNNPCHYGDSILSIDERGYVYGCSFASKPLLKLRQSSDILKIRNIAVDRRFSCPYIGVRNAKD